MKPHLYVVAKAPKTIRDFFETEEGFETYQRQERDLMAEPNEIRFDWRYLLKLLFGRTP